MSFTDKPEDEWYEIAFGDLYPILYSHRDDESASREAEGLAGLLDLSPDNGACMLDVCCGTGRHVAAFQRMGFGICGVDRSAALLAEAHERPELCGCLTRADIRELPFGAEQFSVVLNLFTSFGYFVDEAENERAVREMARILRPGGRFVLDHMNRAFVERKLVERDDHSRPGFDVKQRRWIEDNRVRKEIDIVHHDGSKVQLVEDVRLYTPEEMAALLRAAGLADVCLCGSFDGENFEPESERMIATAIKPRR